ncbi:5714_t:CDS:1 [Dentiscutata erythropus]|uniref:5714_t:CDS:1 n=1 Tax=Dentiscutata erythropus TaxID=1348616 RepID=A0A9N9C4S3_9GLOM|nr:5714_t:CDS:1 [Dentiscutata erythropus]
MSLVDVTKLSRESCQYPIKAELKYATKKNFVGRIINGYDSSIIDVALLMPKAAKALCLTQNYLNEKYGYGILVYDAYRPKRAVQDILSWSKQPPSDEYELERKQKHYPKIEKSQLFDLGYVSKDSGHCYGNTVDVVLQVIKTGEILDMGARYDFMDEISHTTVDSTQIGEVAYKNRLILSEAMQKFGFLPYTNEFWHFSHGGEEGREMNVPLDEVITRK